jgi:hypothetical protein
MVERFLRLVITLPVSTATTEKFSVDGTIETFDLRARKAEN